MAINVTHSKVSTIPDGDDTSLIRPSDWNDDHVLTGLGTMAEQNANAVAITGGTISGVTIPASNLTGTVTVPQGGTGATTLTGYVKGSGTSALTASSTIPNTDITGLGTASTKDAGAALGVATLDAAGKVPISQIPDAVIGALNYQGTWNATTNTPTLTSSVGTKGYYYVVSVAGTTNLNGVTDWQIGDWAVYNGTAWQKVDNTDGVTSVNGFTGAVTLTTTNIAEGTNLYYTDARARGAVSAGTGISYSSSTGVITNSAPDQTVTLTAGTGISTSGTYPNFTITNTAPSLGGTVTSVAATAGTGISVTGSPITSSGTLNITNTAPDQTVVMTSGTGISVTGTYPNFTVTNTSPSSGGTVTSVTATSPVASTGGTTPVISMPAATTSVSGYLTSTDWNTFNSKGSGTVTSVTGTAPVVSSGGATPAISMAAATGSVNGYLTSTDWTTFNNKAPGVTFTTSYVPYGQGTTTLNQSSSFTYANSTLTAPIVSASNGLVVNSNTVSASYSIPSGSSASSVGPMTVASGQTVTVPSGSRWLVL